jgi:glycopeptide antibiotics resistance protein
MILVFWEWRLWKTIQLKASMKFFKKHDASVILGMYVIFLISASLLPLDFHTNVILKLKFILQPFHDYEGTSRIIVILDFFKDMFKYLFFGILLGYFADQKKIKISTIHYGIVISLLFILELLQIFNKIYSPDIVDILLGIIGFIGGMKGYTYVKFQYTQLSKNYID